VAALIEKVLQQFPGDMREFMSADSMPAEEDRIVYPKSSNANKQLMLCFSDDQRTLMDGIGYSMKDKIERILMECSGELDQVHTEEDTLKLMECTSKCLKSEMNQYRSSSWTTFGKRKVLAIQCINNKVTLLSTSLVENKWCFVQQRSAIIPRDWEDRIYWIKVLELLLKLKDLLVEQEQVTVQLKREQVGWVKVDPNDMIRSMIKN